jgi:hypothetical protein
MIDFLFKAWVIIRAIILMITLIFVFVILLVTVLFEELISKIKK